MPKVNTFLDNVKHSLIPHHLYYQKITGLPFHTSVLYFVILLFFINTALFISVLFKFSPSKVHASLVSVEKSVANYPDNLVLTINHGGLVSTYEKPYFFWANNGDHETLLAVIDENATPSKIYEYRAFMLVNARSVTLWPSKESREIHTYPLSFLGDRTVTRTEVESLMSATSLFNRVLPIVYIIVGALFFSLSFISSIIINLVYLALAAAAVLLMFRFIFPRKKTRFLSTYKIGLHAITMPLFVDYGLGLLNMRPPHMHVLFFALLITFVGGGVYEALWVKGKD